MSTPFEVAQAGGVIDLFLSMPDSKDKQSKKFDKIREIANDAETKEMAMPAQYMFKGVPTYDQVDDPVALALAEMDKHNVRRALVGVHENAHAQRGFRDHPDRFLGMVNVDPNQGMDAIRSLEHAVKENGVHAAHTWGTGLNPQVPVGDKKMYPIYAKCVELDIPMIVYAGVPGPRIPLDRIFSELPSVPFRDHVWPKFLRENARRVFGLSS